MSHSAWSIAETTAQPSFPGLIGRSPAATSAMVPESAASCRPASAAMASAWPEIVASPQPTSPSSASTLTKLHTVLPLTRRNIDLMARMVTLVSSLRIVMLLPAGAA